jgi:sodium/potassium-transporting ATPase subunit alpha
VTCSKINYLKGLSTSQVYDNLKRDGQNILSAQAKSHKLISFIENLVGGFGFLLLAGAILCFVAYGIRYYNNNSHLTDNLWLGVALIFVDVLSASFSYYQVFFLMRNNKIIWALFYF